MVTLYIDIFKHFIGINYYAGLNIVPIILYAIFLLGVFFNLSIWYKLKNLTKYGAIITIAGALITFVINWFFIPEYGYLASAWAHFICYLTMVMVSYFLGQRIYRIQYDLKRISLYAILPVVIYIFANNLTISNYSVKMTLHTALFLSYLILILLIERNKLKTIIS
jgi:O-antigen/teichoic acid export membrane protein